jgi:hypothetical protein
MVRRQSGVPPRKAPSGACQFPTGLGRLSVPHRPSPQAFPTGLLHRPRAIVSSRRRTSRAEEGSGAIRCAIRAHQWPYGAIRAHQGPSDEQSGLISGHQEQPGLISGQHLARGVE